MAQRKSTMKFADVVGSRFAGPAQQEFSSWLKKVELGFKVAHVDTIERVDHLLAYMDAPAQDIAITFVDHYTEENAVPAAAAQQKTYYDTLYKALIAHLRSKSAVVGTRPELRLMEQWKNIKQTEGETVGIFIIA